MPTEYFQDYGPGAVAFAAGCVSTWAFIKTWMLPLELKAVKSEILKYEEKVDGLTRRVTELEDKANKYDALMERLAGAELARRE